MFEILTQSPNPQIPGLLVQNEWRGTYEEFEEAVELGDLQGFLRIDPERRTTQPAETSPQALPETKSSLKIPPGATLNPTPAAPGQGRRTSEDEDVLSFLPQGTTVTDAEVDALLKELETPLPRTQRRSYIPSNRSGNEPLPLPTMPTHGAPATGERAKYDPQSRDLVSEAAKTIGVELKPRGPTPRMKLNHRPLHEIMAERRQRMARTENDRRNDELFSILGLSDKNISAEEADAFLRDGTIPDLKASREDSPSVTSSQPESPPKDSSNETGKETSDSHCSPQAPGDFLSDGKDKGESEDVLDDDVDETLQRDDECKQDTLDTNQEPELHSQTTEPTEACEDQISSTDSAKEETVSLDPEQPAKQAEDQERTQTGDSISLKDAPENPDMDVPAPEDSLKNHKDRQLENSPADSLQKDEETDARTPDDLTTESADYEPESNALLDDVSAETDAESKDLGNLVTDGISSSASVPEHQIIDNKNIKASDEDSNKGQDCAETEAEMPVSQNLKSTDPFNDIERSESRSCSAEQKLEEREDDAVPLPPEMASVFNTDQVVPGAKEDLTEDTRKEQVPIEETLTTDVGTGSLPSTTLEDKEGQDDGHDPDIADILEEQKQDTHSMPATQTNEFSNLEDVEPKDKGLEPTNDCTLASDTEDTALAIPSRLSSPHEIAESGPKSATHDVQGEELKAEHEHATWPAEQADTDTQEAQEDDATSQKDTRHAQDAGRGSHVNSEKDSPETVQIMNDKDVISKKAEEPYEDGEAGINLAEESPAHDIINDQKIAAASIAYDEDAPADEDRHSLAQEGDKSLLDTEAVPMEPVSIPNEVNDRSMEHAAELPVERGPEEPIPVTEDAKRDNPYPDDGEPALASVGHEGDKHALDTTEDLVQPTHPSSSVHDEEESSHQVQDDIEDKMEEVRHVVVEEKAIAPDSSARRSSSDEVSSVRNEQSPAHLESSDSFAPVLSVNSQSQGGESLLAADPASPEVLDAGISAAEEEASPKDSHEDIGDVTTVIHLTDDHNARDATLVTAGSESVMEESTNTQEYVNTSPPLEICSSDVQGPALPDLSDMSNAGAQSTVAEQETPIAPDFSENYKPKSLAPMSLDTSQARNTVVESIDSGSVYSNEESAPSSREPWSEGAKNQGTKTPGTSTCLSLVDDSSSTVAESSMLKQDSKEDLSTQEARGKQTKEALLSKTSNTSQEDVGARTDAVEPQPRSNEVDDCFEPRANVPSSWTQESGRRIVTTLPAAESRPKDITATSSTRTVSQPAKPSGHRRTISDILREADEILQASKE